MSTVPVELVSTEYFLLLSFSLDYSAIFIISSPKLQRLSLVGCESRIVDISISARMKSHACGSAVAIAVHT